MLSDKEIEQLIKVAEKDAIEYCGDDSDIAYNRALFYDRYNSEKFGTPEEKRGRSTVVISNTFNTIEGMMPDLVQDFDRGNNPVTFTAKAKQYDNQAEEKTNFFTKVFDSNQGKKVIYSMIKDGLLQYTGWVKTYQEEIKTVKVDKRRNINEMELELYLMQNNKAKEVERVDNKDGTFDILFSIVEKKNRTKIETIPANQCLVSRSAISFEDAAFIGQRTPTTRSMMKQMGIDPKKVDALAAEPTNDSIVDNAKDSQSHNHYYNGTNDQVDRSQQQLYLGEYYMLVDVDQDGISELWQFFYCDETLLKKTMVHIHPYSVFVPIPVTHRAFGTCPAQNLVELEYWHSTMVRQMNDNVYATNWNRAVINDQVELDDYLSPRHGGAVRVKGAADVRMSIMPLPVINQVPAVLEAIAYIETERERITGVTAHNQGMQTDNINPTATGFTGISNMSMKRLGLIARQARNTLIDVAKKAITAAKNHGEDGIEIEVNGEIVKINPSKWGEIDDCFIDAGVGVGDIQQKIANLAMILQEQKYHLENQTGLADTVVMFEAYDKLCLYTDMKDASSYFNNTEIPEEQMQGQIEQLSKQLQQAQTQLKEFETIVLTEGEKTKGAIMREQMRIESNEKIKLAELQHKQKVDIETLLQSGEKMDDDYDIKVTDMELTHNKDLPGGLDGAN